MGFGVALGDIDTGTFYPWSLFAVVVYIAPYLA